LHTRTIGKTFPENLTTTLSTMAVTVLFIPFYCNMFMVVSSTHRCSKRLPCWDFWHMNLYPCLRFERFLFQVWSCQIWGVKTLEIINFRNYFLKKFFHLFRCANFFTEILSLGVWKNVQFSHGLTVQFLKFFDLYFD
jgi:hypothetical protein